MLSTVIFPGLIKNVPSLMSETFAKNILNTKFRIRGLYPNQDYTGVEESVYIPSEVI